MGYPEINKVHNTSLLLYNNNFIERKIRHRFIMLLKMITQDH